MAPAQGFFLVGFPDFEPQRVGEDTLAICRALLGELVRFALQKERGIDEGFIIQAQGLDDSFIRGTQSGFSQRMPTPAFVLLRKFQQGGLPTGFGALHFIAAFFVIKNKNDFGRLGTIVDDAVIPAARLPK